MPKNKKTIIALLIIPQYLLISLLSNYPELVEQYYSNGVYPYISKIFRYVLGWLPFSFGDLIYTFGIIYALRWFYKNRKRLRKDTKQWFVDIFAALSIIYFAFHLFWGINYYRLPLHKSLDLKHDYTTGQLVLVAEKLINKSNEYHLKITNNDTLKVTIPYSKKAIFEKASNGFTNLKQVFPNLEYHPKSVKKSIFTYPLSYMGISGYLNPFTSEAQVNGLIPIHKFPTTTSHEIAHQLGFAAENEANFVGFMAAIHHDDIYFKYAGYTFGLRYCLNEIYRRDACLYEDMLADVNKGILKNYEETRQFWKAHLIQPIRYTQKLFFDSYLKANKQDKGMDSYSYVVALLVNYFEVTPID